MKYSLPSPLNQTQHEFKRLCELGSGLKGGPADGKVRELLRSSGKRLNIVGFEIMSEHLETFPDANPWHVCFAVGLSWGHLAKLDVEFTRAVVELLQHWNDDSLRDARSFHIERGPQPIEESLIGASMLFSRVALPAELPTTLPRLQQAQDLWLGAILGPERPRYIGSWNATAMFMTALFAKPKLAAEHVKPPPVLPPGGPIYAGLQLLHETGVLFGKPEGNELDDYSFEPGALYINNSLLAELCSSLTDCSLIDIHGGIYMLGTRDPRSDSWT